MAAWTTVSATNLEPGDPWTSALAQAAFENPEAIAEGASNAPVVQAGWHPYDMVDVGDGADGEIYSFGTDGAVASVETTTFADGYEYLIFFDRITSSATSDLIIEGYKDTDAAYSSYWTSADNVASGDEWTGAFRVDLPRLDKVSHGITFVVPPVHETAGIFTIPTGNGYIQDVTVQSIGKVRLSFDAGNINGGAIYLYRRREYVTG